MSDSELSDLSGSPVPPDNELEQSLRREVVRTAKAGAEITVKRIRAASEKKLGLPEGFYKGHPTWKDLSKTIIEDQVNNEGEVPDSPVSTKSNLKDSAKQTKRSSLGVVDKSPQNRRKKRKVSDDEEEDDDSDKQRSAARGDEKPAKKSVEIAEDNRASDSDLSILIDEEPPKKKTQQAKSKPSQDRSKQQSRQKPKAKQEEQDTDQAEIKRLQGWLVKCGIRKVWSRELSSYDTPKAKIRHLREMLSDAGMTGRFSIEKANKIKEQREMAADIEAIKEGEERWGAGHDDGPSKNERPGRKLVRGSQHLAFLSDDGEETD